MQLRLLAPEADSKACSRRRALSEGASSGRQRADSTEFEGEVDYRLVVRRTFLDLEVSSTSSRPADASSTVAGSSEADSERRASTPCWSDNEDEDEHTPQQEEAAPEQGAAQLTPGYSAQRLLVPCYMVPVPLVPNAGGSFQRSQAQWSAAPPPPPPPPPPAAVASAGAASRAQQPVASPGAQPTTLLLKRLWASCTTQDLAELLDRLGFVGCYDFLYVPANLRESKAFGFAFVNMVSHLAALVLKEHFDGFVVEEGREPLAVQWCDAHQGLAAQIERYRESPIMHEDVLDRFKPMLFQNGRRQPFPPPTRPVQFPSNAGGRTPRPRAGRLPAPRSRGERR